MGKCHLRVELTPTSMGMPRTTRPLSVRQDRSLTRHDVAISTHLVKGGWSRGLVEGSHPFRAAIAIDLCSGRHNVGAEEQNSGLFIVGQWL